jgi:hypothetical protein
VPWPRETLYVILDGKIVDSDRCHEAVQGPSRNCRTSSICLRDFGGPGSTRRARTGVGDRTLPPSMFPARLGLGLGLTHILVLT